MAASDGKTSFDNNEKNNENTEEYWRLCAMHLATASVLPMVLKSAVELGVLEIIAKLAGPEGGGVSADDVASQLELTKDATTTTASSMLDRMLCLLSAHNILTCTSTDDQTRRLYGLAPIAKYFIPNSDGVSFAPFLSLVQDKVLLDNWDELKPAVLEGGSPFDRLHGMYLFEYTGTDPRFNEIFNKAMINHTTIVINEILHVYKGFDKIHRLVDVGGGLGVTLKFITSKYPHIKGINFDLPHVTKHGLHYPSVKHVAGDMFESVPGGDAIILKWILHDWNDDHCLRLLKNCHKALPDNGIVIVVEGLLPLVPDNSPSHKGICNLDVIMMAANPGGKERTRQQFLSLANAAGFAGIRFDSFACNFWVMEFYKQKSF